MRQRRVHSYTEGEARAIIKMINEVFEAIPKSDKRKYEKYYQDVVQFVEAAIRSIKDRSRTNLKRENGLD